jgi:NADPH2:quinone reductase
MRAIGYRKPSPELDHLETFDIPRPTPEGRDLLVEVRAVSVNPVDYKLASGGGPGGAASETSDIKVVGYDAAGVVAETGREASLFKPGDEVFYAGSIGRPGANMEFHLVDERIVGRKPHTLDFAAAAALPLTSITAGGDVRPDGRQEARSRRGARNSNPRRGGRRRFDRHSIGASIDRSRDRGDRLAA